MKKGRKLLLQNSYPFLVRPIPVILINQQLLSRLIFILRNLKVIARQWNIFVCEQASDIIESFIVEEILQDSRCKMQDARC